MYGVCMADGSQSVPRFLQHRFSHVNCHTLMRIAIKVFKFHLGPVPVCLPSMQQVSNARRVMADESCQTLKNSLDLPLAQVRAMHCTSQACMMSVNG